jgi:Tfp pilus assembly protein PilX
MLFLTLMSFMGLAAMQSAGLGEKMAANYRYGVTAFHAAEAGIELAIKNHTNNSISTSISGELGQSSYNATIIDSAGVYTVTSNGAHSNSGAKREIVATLSGAVGSKPTIVNWISSE